MYRLHLSGINLSFLFLLQFAILLHDVGLLGCVTLIGGVMAETCQLNIYI